MKEIVYLVGQISKEEYLTYQWRKNIVDAFKENNLIQIIDPCSNTFNQAILKDDERDSKRLKVYQYNGIELLVPKDFSYVKHSTICVANLIHYDKKKMIIGSFFELSAYYLSPEKSVIGILDKDPGKDMICNHPFVKATVDVWVKSEQEAIDLIKYYYC